MINKLGSYIKYKYKEKNLTQIEYAVKCELSVNTIRNIEKGKYKKLPLDTYHALAKGLEITTKQLLEDIGEIGILNQYKLNSNKSQKLIEAISPFLYECNITDLNKLNSEQKLEIANEIIHFIKILSSKY